MKRIRLLLADDHTLVLEGIRKLLENEFDLIGAFDNAHELLEAAVRLRPDVILLDISMPLLNGIEACRQLMKSIPDSRIIFLTMHADVVYVEEALRAGAAGYLIKRSAAAELSGAINAVMRGGKYVTPLIDWKESTASTSRNEGDPLWRGRLTARQREVLQLVAEGRANKEIAAILQISEKTVDFHKSSIKRELMLGSTAELTQFAIRHGIIGI